MYYEMKKHLNQLNQKISNITKELSLFPAGKLMISKDHNTFRWYVSIDGKTEYLRKTELIKAKALAKKRYLEKKLAYYKSEAFSAELYLKHSPVGKSKEFEILAGHPGYAPLLRPQFAPLNEKLSSWQNEKFPSNPYHPEHLTSPSISGHILRSKSESMIDALLFTHKIPFRYESELVIDGVALYPDFTIRHPKTGKFYYWAHMGRMDDPQYIRRKCEELIKLIKIGIVPGVNLILTFETKECQLDMLTIEEIIQKYFLSQ